MLHMWKCAKICERNEKFISITPKDLHKCMYVWMPAFVCAYVCDDVCVYEYGHDGAKISVWMRISNASGNCWRACMRKYATDKFILTQQQHETATNNSGKSNNQKGCGRMAGGLLPNRWLVVVLDRLCVSWLGRLPLAVCNCKCFDECITVAALLRLFMQAAMADAGCHSSTNFGSA